MKKLFIIFLWLICISLNATDYYVKNGGNDALSGLDDANAWATLSKVNSVSFSPGDNIYFKKGSTFTGSGLTPSVSGTDVNYITFASYDAGADPIIEPTGYGVYFNDINYIVVNGIVFECASNSSDGIKFTGGASSGSTHNIISYCTIQNAYKLGILIGIDSDYNTISHCNIHNNSRDPSLRGYSIYVNSKHNIIEYNNCHDEGTSGMQMYTGYSGYSVDYNIIRYNFFHDNGAVDGGDGLTATVGTGNEIYYNIFANNVGYGLRLQYGSNNSEVYNNTSFGNSYGIAIYSDCANTIVRNNIMYNNTTNYYNGSASTVASNNLTSNPLFQNDGGSYLLDTDFRIQSESDAINYGVDVSLTEDYEGNVITGLPDAGAFEYVADLPAVDPVVIITTSVFVGTTTATSGGNVTDDGGGTVTARGVCWSTSANPTTADSKTSDGTGAGAFVSLMNPLLPATTYHVRAYATNEAGTGYGSDIEFTTTSDSGLGGDPIFINGKILMNGDKIIIK